MRPIRNVLLPLGAFVLAISLSACGAAQTASDTLDKGQSGASKASEAIEQGTSKLEELQRIVNSMPTDVAQIRDQITDKIQTAPLVLDMKVCSNQDSVNEAQITDIGNNWPKGPYMTIAEQSASKNGDYTAVDPKTYGARQIGQSLPLTTIHPTKTWHWNCGTPKDHVGWLRFSIVRFDENGKPVEATKWAYLQVTNTPKQ